MNKKYISPVIKIESVKADDVILASGSYQVAALEGVDQGEDKSAIFSVSHWFH